MTGTATEPRPAATAAGRGSTPRLRSRTTIVAVGVLAIAVAVLLSLTVGAVMLSPGQAFSHLLDARSSSQEAAIVGSRVDRVLVGLLVGAAVAVAGAVLQGVTRNPLADPSILGINSGAALAVILGIYWFDVTSMPVYLWLGLIGAGVAAALVYGIASLGPRGPQPVTMALAGAAFTAGASSVVSGIMVSSSETLEVFRFWQVGSISGRDMDALPAVLPVFAVGFVLCLAVGGVLNALALGDDLARALGQRILLGRGLAWLGAVVLCAAATAVAGPIAFVGLVVPHVVRLLVGPDHRRILLGSLLGGPVLVILADTLGRVVTPPSEVSVGIMTAVIGAPVLVLLVRRMAAR
ncbi:iron ABC transporter permease [Luteipulveratus sp. YIM 133132]|uniref:FecCD family ABC transporter permease n=1 Tax=Luteipulveratus flavus TaxID=3031728 RepID=UPI0023B07FB1|nr:iron ABC transporter permease [Luteipulveratus sp. YIM 133132]MDE9366660.1 iron ABC transporter permease [Luteipulveratus sp. YIM 133132]